MKMKNVITEIEKLAPAFLACEWDNSGLQVGKIGQRVERILLTLDITEEVLAEAITQGCNLIISHHPLLFNGLKSVNDQTQTGRIIMKAIKNNITIYTAHTNLDIAPDGLNDYLASLLTLKSAKPLDITSTKKYYKLNVYIPEDHFQKVKQSIFAAGAGKVGNYSHSSFSTSGISTFKPLGGSNPFQGKKGKVNSVDEIKFSTIVLEDKLNKVIKALFNVHPYEEIAYDLYPLSDQEEEYGIGRIGNLEHEVKLARFFALVKETLNMKKLKIAGPLKSKVKRIALCTGAGSDYIKVAGDKGADVYLTGEVKYHDAQLAEKMGLTIINAGHFKTETIVKNLLAEYLIARFKDIDIIKSKINTDPWQEV